MKQPIPSGEGADIDFATLFAANIHEIKNLLFLLFNAIDGASSEPWACGNPEAQATLCRIKYGSSLIGQRLAHVLALYRISQGRYELDIDYHDGNELLREILLETSSLVGEGGVGIRIEDGEEVYGFFDREMVRGILINAVHNALHYARTAIVLSVATEDGYLRFRVADDSPGYPEDILENGGAQAKLHLGGGGTGLGLYFSATAAALHRSHGRTGFTRLSNGGALGGAVFELLLP